MTVNQGISPFVVALFSAGWSLQNIRGRRQTRKNGQRGRRKRRQCRQSGMNDSDREAYAGYGVQSTLNVEAPVWKGPEEASLDADRGSNGEKALLHGHHIAAQCQSKLQRLMKTYELYKFVSGLSGAGIDSDTGITALDNDTWEVFERKDKESKPALRQFHRCGFAHGEICSLLAGDTKTTGADGRSIDEFLEPGLDTLSGRQVAAETYESSSGGAVARQADREDNLAGQPASHAQRAERVKRHRDGRVKAAQKLAPKPSLLEHEEAISSVIAAFQMTAELFRRRIRDMNGDQ